MTRRSLGSLSLSLSLTLALAMPVVLTACGGLTRFEDTTPLVLASPVPPPPPPPPPEPARVEVKQDRIEIKDKIQFAFDKAEILSVSDGLLSEVAAAIKAHAEIKKLGIHGHTDGEGESAYNQSLSERRAQAVKAWLVAHGVEAPRLEAKGFGESKPIADNASPEGREKNRRVEFLIVEQEGVK